MEVTFPEQKEIFCLTTSTAEPIGPTTRPHRGSLRGHKGRQDLVSWFNRWGI